MMMKNRRRFFRRQVLFPAALLFSALAAGCSSAPRRPEAVYTDRNMAANQLALADQTANRGRYADALIIADEVWRVAVATDDPPLRIKTAMSRGNILFSLGRHDEAFQAWESAAAEGDGSGEPVLAALARIYAIRARLVLLGSGPSPGGEAASAAAAGYKEQLLIEMDRVRQDDFAVAAGNVTLGMAEKQLGRWAGAEEAVLEALETHEDGLYLEDAAYDWFLIASIRSQAGDYGSSVEALWAAIGFDRRAENSFGLAASWQAMGEVYAKAGRPGESAAALRRAADIYRAAGLTARAEELEARL